MDKSAVITAVAGLAGAVIGALAALIGQFAQSKAQTRTDAEGERKLAIAELLVRSQAIDLHAHQMALLAANVGSFTGLLSRAVGSVAPVDFVALFDRMNHEASALQRAAAQVWLFGERETIAYANAVVLAATEIVTVHHEPSTGRLRNYMQVAFTGQQSTDHERIQAARKKLADARKALIVHTRTALRLDETDPFALAPLE